MPEVMPHHLGADMIGMPNGLRYPPSNQPINLFDFHTLTHLEHLLQQQLVE